MSAPEGPAAPTRARRSEGNGNRPPRAVATSVDELEESFQRKKRRELEQARMAGSGEAQTVQQVVRGTAKVGRNDPCPCGSGKKYKKCCGAQGSVILSGVATSRSEAAAQSKDPYQLNETCSAGVSPAVASASCPRSGGGTPPRQPPGRRRYSDTAGS